MTIGKRLTPSRRKDMEQQVTEWFFAEELVEIKVDGRRVEIPFAAWCVDEIRRMVKANVWKPSIRYGTGEFYGKMAIFRGGE